MWHKGMEKWSKEILCLHLYNDILIYFLEKNFMVTPFNILGHYSQFALGEKNTGIKEN